MMGSILAHVRLFVKRPKIICGSLTFVSAEVNLLPSWKVLKILSFCRDVIKNFLVLKGTQKIFHGSINFFYNLEKIDSNFYKLFHIPSKYFTLYQYHSNLTAIKYPFRHEGVKMTLYFEGVNF